MLLRNCFRLFLSFLLIHFAIAAALVVSYGVLVEHGGQKTNHPLVAAKRQFQLVHDVAFPGELNQVVIPG